MRFLACALALLLAIPARGVDRHQIATVNIAATSLFTFLGCVVQGRLQKRVQTRRDAGRCFAAGAAGGIGFYQAKRLVAGGDITTGWLLANLATSVVENTAAGEHPFSRIGYTFGPFRLRFATPADPAHESYIDLDLSVVETGFLARTLIDADDVDIRDGMLQWETEERLTEGGLVFNGYTWGIYPGAWTRAQESTWNHEAVHAIQAMQLDSVEPPALILGRNRQPFRIRYIRAGAVNLTDNLFWGQRAYGDRWVEIEAYRLANGRKPPQ
jgi:hypothetical protein